MKLSNQLWQPFKGILHDVMIGISLGDAHIRTKTMGKSWTLRFNQGLRNSAYCHHLYDLFSHLCNQPPKNSVDNDMRTGSLVQYHKVTWQTRVTPELHYYGHLFYTWDALKPRRVGNGIGTWVKGMPVNIVDLISPISLAYLYMDDGHLPKSGALLCLGGFTNNELEIFRLALETKWGLVATIHSQGKIYIWQESLPIFINLISPYIIDEMKYKIGGKKVN